jgi:nitrite reductase/ring-hydroxylating ferredoxin subunit
MTLRDWHVAALRELADGCAREFQIGAGDWPMRGFVVHWQGAVYAYRNRCPHAGHPLNLDPESFFAPGGKTLICASHGAQFLPASGVCVAGPCIGAALEALPCRVDAGEIWVTAPASERS